MIIDLSKEIASNRMTRVVIGEPSSSDISTIFESKERDFLTDVPITHENFDEDDVYYVQNVGYTRRQSLVDAGYKSVKIDTLYSPITGKNFRTVL